MILASAVTLGAVTPGAVAPPATVPGEVAPAARASTDVAAPLPTDEPATDAQPAPPTPLPPLPAPEPTGAPPVLASPDPSDADTVDREVLVEGRSRRGDPLEAINAESFGAAQSVDKALIGPVALAYRKAVPNPLRSGLRNFLGNLREPVVALNYLLQLKPGKAAETVGRFAINTTVGVAGVFDVAKRRGINLPHRRNGFANTLGYYGVKPGPFFFLPLIGPTTLRDAIGNVLDQVLVPIGTVKPFNQVEFTVPIGILSALDYRAEFDDELERQRATRDPYAASRKYYLDRRQAEIDALRGRLPPGAPDPSLRKKGKAQ